MASTFTKRIRKHIFLHPVDKKRRYAAIKAALLKDKRKYSDKLNGALLDVSNLKVIGDRHLVVEGYISMEVEADCLVFAPQPGQVLEGLINKQSYGHIGCLVMDIFNATLSLPSQQEQMPQPGDLVSFAVNEVIVDGEILFMRGTLESVISHSEHVKQEPGEPGTGVKEEPTQPSSKQRKSRKRSLDTADIKSEEDTSPEKITVFKTERQSPEADSPPKSKKKKRKKNKEGE